MLLADAATAAPIALAPPVVVDGAHSSRDAYAPPAVASADDGSFVVAFARERRVYVRGFDAAVRPRGAATPASATAGATPVAPPQIVALPGGGFLVVWSELTVAEGSDRVMARLLAADGSPTGLPLPLDVLDDQRSWPGGPAVAADGNGVIAIAWSRQGRLVVRRFVATPASLLGLRPVGMAVDLGPGIYPSVVGLPTGHAVAALQLGPRWWRGSAIDNDQVLLRWLAVAGEGSSRQYTVTMPGAIQALAVRVTADAAGRILLAWNEVDPDGDLADSIRSQRFAANGTALDAPSELATGDGGPTGEAISLALGDALARPDGTVLLTWSRGEPSVCGGTADPPFPPPPFPLAPNAGPTNCAAMRSGDDLLARVFTADGAPAGDPVLVAAAEGQDEVAARGAVTAAGWLALHHGSRLEVTPLRVADCGEREIVDALCLRGRFHVEVEWSATGIGGTGGPLGVAADTGSFWFFSPTNIELLVKVLDGTEVNGHHWVFFASLTDVAFELVVTDTVTGVERRYANPRGTMASRADVAAFPEAPTSGRSLKRADYAPFGEESAVPGRLPVARALRADPRAGDEEPARKARAAGATHPLPATAAAPAAALSGDRFTATVDWRLRDGTSGTATAVPLSDDTALFWFFSPQNLEMAIKVLDGAVVNGHHWVFFASLTDVEFDLTVVDHATGERRTYHNPAGAMASRADVEAFP